jgi:hypothetical protein
MEDKNIVINGTKYNSFKFYNINQPVTDLRYLNNERLVFTKPVTRKLPNNNIPFNRIYLAISGPKPRTVQFTPSETVKMYDMDELLDYDNQFKSEDNDTEIKPELSKKYKLAELIETDEFRALVDYEWYQNNIDSALKEPSFIYNISDRLYIAEDETKQRELVLRKFAVFDATKMIRAGDISFKKVKGHCHILVTKKWVKGTVSEKYWKYMTEEYSPLVFASDEVFSFGVSRNTLDDRESYQISLCLYDRDNPKDEQIKWAAKYEELAVVCRDYLKKSEFKKQKGNIESMKGLSWKGNEVGDPDGPKLYPKVMYHQNKGEFITVFTDSDDQIIEDPKTVLDKRCKIQVALRFESIFIGSKIALQVRVNDVYVVNWIEAFKQRPLITRKRSPKQEDIVSESENESADDSDLNSEDEEVAVSKPKRNVTTVSLNA